MWIDPRGYIASACLLLCFKLCGSAVFFPTNSAYGIFAAIAVPLDLPHRNVFLSYNFEANYNLPATWSIPPVALNIEDEDFFEEARLNNANDCANCTISGEKSDRDDLSDLHALKNVTKTDAEAGQKPPRRRRKRRQREALLTRTHFYYIMRHKFERHGYNGEPCLLRLICDTNASGLGEINGVLGTLVHVIFSPSTSMNEHLPLAYYQAEVDGRNGACVHYAEACTKNPLDLISITVEEIIGTLTSRK